MKLVENHLTRKILNITKKKKIVITWDDLGIFFQVFYSKIFRQISFVKAQFCFLKRVQN